MTFSSALPNFHHTWLSFQTHVACRRSSQQVGSHFAHQHPHLEVCAFDRGNVTLSILNRSIQSFSKYPWLTLLRSPFGFPLVWRCVIHRISYSSSCRVAVFSQDCSAHSWRQNVSLLIHNGLPNELFRNVPKALNRSVFSFSLKLSISTARWTAGCPCVVSLELACCFCKNLCVLINFSECGVQ